MAPRAPKDIADQCWEPDWSDAHDDLISLEIPRHKPISYFLTDPAQSTRRFLSEVVTPMLCGPVSTAVQRSPTCDIGGGSLSFELTDDNYFDYPKKKKQKQQQKKVIQNYMYISVQDLHVSRATISRGDTKTPRVSV